MGFRDIPGGPVVKNPSCNAGDASLIPGWGIKIPHAAGQLSRQAATTELMRSVARAQQQRARAPQLRPDAAKKEKKRKNDWASESLMAEDRDVLGNY